MEGTMLDKINPTDTTAWKKLTAHYKTMKRKHMRDMFLKDPGRFSKLSLMFEDMTVDFSKNILSDRTLKLLLELAQGMPRPECDRKDVQR